jgi:hypothetical protein
MSEFEQLINLLERSKEVIKSQSEIINSQLALFKDLETIIEFKDKTIDTQLQMLQTMELKLKEFGINLGDSDLLASG